MFRLKILALSLFVFSAMSGIAQSLPTVTLQGKSFYYYEVKKGDSLYGIAKDNGWDIEKLKSLNPVVALELKKGARLYYPVQDNAPFSKDNITPDQTSTRKGDIIRHTVAKGETVYFIARKYGVPVDLIYYQNPDSRSSIKAGEILTIDRSIPIDDAVIYVIQSGDTPFGVAKKFNCAVEDIYRDNPGVNDRNFKTGSTIKVAANANLHRMKSEKVVSDKLDRFSTYKVGKDESWEGIARKTGTSVEELQRINPGTELKRGVTISVPEYEEVETIHRYVAQDPREKTEEGRMEIFQDVTESMIRTHGKVKAVIILDSPSSKKDMEFCRGFITAVDKYKKADFKIDLDIIRGDRTQEEIVEDINRIKPNLIIPTTEKDLPAFLSDYARDNYASLVNVFNLKDNAFRTNASVVQLMPPTAEFNETITKYIEDTFPNRKIVIVSASDEEDMVARLLESRIDNARILTLTIDELQDYPFYETESYLVYATPTKKTDVTTLIDILQNVKEESPLTEISVVGRPNWITFSDGMKEKLCQNDVYIPSRFYFDMGNSDSKAFLAAYRYIFRHPPLKSFPVYAVMGYDVGNFFLPLQAYSPEDYSVIPSTSTPQLQVDIDLKKQGENGGYLNSTCYLIRYTPAQYVDKIKIE